MHDSNLHCVVVSHSGTCICLVTDPPPTNTGLFHFSTCLVISILAALFVVQVLTLLLLVKVPIEFQDSPEPVTMSPQNYVPMEYRKHPQVNYPTPEPAINHSTLSDSLLQYQVYLHDVYRSYNYSMNSANPSEFVAVNRPERPINLVLVHKEKKTETSHNEQIKFAFHGKVDEIQRRKIPMKIEKIGSFLNVAAHFVLIEGAAGVGKSTLCWQLCKLWLEGISG